MRPLLSTDPAIQLLRSHRSQITKSAERSSFHELNLGRDLAADKITSMDLSEGASQGNIPRTFGRCIAAVSSAAEIGSLITTECSGENAGIAIEKEWVDEHGLDPEHICGVGSIDQG